MIGFDFHPTSLNFLPAEMAKEIRGWLYGPRVVGEFSGYARSGQTAADMQQVIEVVQPDMIEAEPGDLEMVRTVWQGPIIVRLNGSESNLGMLRSDDVELAVLDCRDVDTAELATAVQSVCVADLPVYQF